MAAIPIAGMAAVMRANRPDALVRGMYGETVLASGECKPGKSATQATADMLADAQSTTLTMDELREAFADG